MKYFPYKVISKDICILLEALIVFRNPASENNSNVLSVKTHHTMRKFFFKETKPVTMNIFRKKIFSFKIICQSRIKLCLYNKNVEYT